MLELTIERSDLKQGSKILDLGCGWGSFSLYAAMKFPEKNFTAVSNSHSQRKFIEGRANDLGIKNLNVITSDINDFNPHQQFDRIVSVEMFEHVRNYDLLFNRIRSWLVKNGKLFVHIFNHKKYAYKFEAERKSDWMARHFFSGGMMPSDELLFKFSKGFRVEGHWNINGRHYSKTLEAWLDKMDKNKVPVVKIFMDTYGDEAKKFRVYWRIFFLACSETFRMKSGNEWQVSHYLFEKE
jgi:cyclopropane-fatty-acyl-phospholipid synthase